MRAGKSLSVSSADIRRFKTLVQDRNASQKHVWRPEIIVPTVDGIDATDIMRRTDKSKPYVWRLQKRFVEEGIVGLL
jgi:hypothetical protein